MLLIKSFFYRVKHKLGDYVNGIYNFYIKLLINDVGVNCRFCFPTYLVGGRFISIGDNFDAGLRFRLEAISLHLGVEFKPKILIGTNVSINHDCHIGAVNEIIIGNDVLIASKVFISDHFHGAIDSNSIKISPSKRILFSKGPVVIGNGVWIGEGVAILPNVKIGDNCIIGANSVVTRSFGPNTVIGGNPARILKVL